MDIQKTYENAMNPPTPSDPSPTARTVPLVTTLDGLTVHTLDGVGLVVAAHEHNRAMSTLTADRDAWQVKAVRLRDAMEEVERNASDAMDGFPEEAPDTIAFLGNIAVEAITDTADLSRLVCIEREKYEALKDAQHKLRCAEGNLVQISMAYPLDDESAGTTARSTLAAIRAAREKEAK